jgi:hypothetical protein
LENLLIDFIKFEDKANYFGVRWPNEPVKKVVELCEQEIDNLLEMLALVSEFSQYGQRALFNRKIPFKGSDMPYKERLIAAGNSRENSADDCVLPSIYHQRAAVGVHNRAYVLEHIRGRSNSGQLTPRAYPPELYQQCDKDRVGRDGVQPGMRGNKKIIDPNKLTTLRNGRKLGKSFHLTNFAQRPTPVAVDTQYHEDLMRDYAPDNTISPIHGSTLNDKRNFSPKDYATLHERSTTIDRNWVRDSAGRMPRINNGIIGVGQHSKKKTKGRDNVIETDNSDGRNNRNDLIETADSPTN